MVDSVQIEMKCLFPHTASANCFALFQACGMICCTSWKVLFISQPATVYPVISHNCWRAQRSCTPSKHQTVTAITISKAWYIARMLTFQPQPLPLACRLRAAAPSKTALVWVTATLGWVGRPWHRSTMETWAGTERGCPMPASPNRRRGNRRMGSPETLASAGQKTAPRVRALVLPRRTDSCPAGKSRTQRKRRTTAWWRRARNEGGGNWSARQNVSLCLLLAVDSIFWSARVTSTRCWEGGTVRGGQPERVCSSTCRAWDWCCQD